MSSWIPSDPQPKSHRLLEPHTPSLPSVAKLQTRALASLSWSLQTKYETPFPASFTFWWAICLPISFPGCWFNSDLQSPLWHPRQVNLSNNFKRPMVEHQISHVLTSFLRVTWLRHKRRAQRNQVSHSLCCQILQVPFQGPLISAFPRQELQSKFFSLV